MIDRSEFKRVAEKALIRAAEDAAKFGSGRGLRPRDSSDKRQSPQQLGELAEW